jgi:hypothetical protein
MFVCGWMGIVDSGRQGAKPLRVALAVFPESYGHRPLGIGGSILEFYTHKNGWFRKLGYQPLYLFLDLHEILSDWTNVASLSEDLLRRAARSSPGTLLGTTFRLTAALGLG